MGERSAIEWTDATWNPTRGCSRISPGCLNCYAEKIAGRFSGPDQPYEGFAEMSPSGARWTGQVRVHGDALDKPLHWRKPRKIFVNSMSDLFHERLTDEEIERVFGVMALAPWHTFQVLTKRADRMERWFRERGGLETREECVMRAAEHLGQKLWGGEGAPFAFDSRGSDPQNYMPRHRDPKALKNRRRWPGWPLPNVWIGASVEDQQRANERGDHLVRTPAAFRFFSCEPLIEGLSLGRWLYAIDWVIVGGESGQDARPMHPTWAREIRDQCAKTGVAFFFKQWGDYRPTLASVAGKPEPKGGMDNWGTLTDEGDYFHLTTPWNGRQLEDSENNGECVVVKVGKKKAGAILDGREHRAFPDTDAVPVLR